MDRGSQLKVSSNRLVQPEIEPATPGLQGKKFIHYNTVIVKHEFFKNDNNHKLTFSDFTAATALVRFFCLRTKQR